MMHIRSIACALPDGELTNAALAREHPSWDMERVAAKTGVHSRRVTAPGETAFDLSARACDSLIAESDFDLERIDALVYCTQAPDYLLPSNAQLLHRRLGLGDEVFAFDYSLGCSGFVYGLAFAESFAAAGLASEVLVVTAETYSKIIHPGDRSARVLFGDGAAAAHVSAAPGDGGRIVATKLCTHGQPLEACYIPAGGARLPRSAETASTAVDRNGNVRSDDYLHLDGIAIWSFVNSTVPGHLRAFLAEQSLGFEDIDLCVFHQASQMTLDSLARALGLEPGMLYVNLGDVGNLGATSVPFALRAALDDGSIAPGNRVLLSAYGVGGSYGSALVEF